MWILGWKEMTKDEKIKLRAEIAGKAMAALFVNSTTSEPVLALAAVDYADALMAELGLSIEDGEG